MKFPALVIEYPMSSYKIKKTGMLMLLALLLLPVLCHAGETGAAVPRLLSPGDHPAAETVFVPDMRSLPAAAIDPAWYVKTGGKKGLIGRAEMEEELLAAPDAAVLARGFHVPWEGILAGYQAPVLSVLPDDIAGLAGTKPLLIIPTGALAGAAESSFFRAGLAEYVQSGGVIFCLSQRRGADFSVLPVPYGQRLEAAGWSEDSGPLFRAAKIGTGDPFLSGIPGPAPSIETDGYFTAYPENSRLFLLLPEGHPTVLAYPFGKGWVVATTLFTDFSALLGNLESDEQKLLGNLMAWSKAPSKSLPSASSRPGSAADEKQDGIRTTKTASPGKTNAARLSVLPMAERKGDRLKLSLEILPDAGLNKSTVTVRTEGREKSLVLSRDKALLSFELPTAGSGDRVSYAVYGADGRAIARGSVAVPREEESSVFPARQFHFPGDVAAVKLAGMGQGELTLSGMGYLGNAIIGEGGGFDLPVPHDLPAGTYPMQWSFEEINGTRTEGEFPIDLCGYRAAFDTVMLEQKRDGERITGTAAITVRTTQRVSGRMKLVVRGPEGETIGLAEPAVSLVEGAQTIPLSYSFKPESAGIWELRYSLDTVLPQGAGIPSEPVVLARGSSLFDTGGNAVLALTTDKPLYYEPSGPVDITASLFGNGRPIIEVSLDGKQVSREQIELDGIGHYHAQLPRMNAGTHTVRVSLLADRGGVSVRDRTFTYGLRLPDLTVHVATGAAQHGASGPVMPVSILVRNEGKSQAGPCSVFLYDGDPAKNGRLIVELAVPALAPKGSHTLSHDWPLYGQAGTHAIVAVADRDDRVKEARESNNTSSAGVTVPDMLLLANAGQTAFSLQDPVSFPVSVFSLGNKRHKDLSLDMRILDAAGKNIASETVPVDRITPGSEKRIAHTFRFATAPAGAYTFNAILHGDRQPAAVASSFDILPSLLLAGTLEGTPPDTAPCRPFPVRYSIRSAGNIHPSSGTLRFDILSSGEEKSLYTKTFPLSLEPKSFVIDNLDLPEGVYVMRVTASAANEQYKINKEFTAAEQTFSVTGPVQVRRETRPFPRVLLWLGREGRVVEQAMAESIVKQAFDGEDLYYKTVFSEEEFSAQAMTGKFNAFFLFEPDQMPAKSGQLQDLLDARAGVAIIGSGDTARTLAERLGFALEEASLKKGTPSLSFPDNSLLRLSGNLPIAGKAFIPRKKGAKTAAFFFPGNHQAAVVDGSSRGKLLIMPLSLSRSALQGGTPALYSLVLRNMALFVSPETDMPGGAYTGMLSVSSSEGPVKAIIKEILPEGAAVLWTNADGRADKNVITYDLEADREGRKILYLYQTPAAGDGSPVTEVHYECGRLMSGGRSND